MPTPTWRVVALLFGSGSCALVYQIGWMRELGLIFGASTAASAAVLAIFIGGLGLGGLLLGPRADRHPRPLLFYAQLEAVVAISAAASPLLLALVRQFYIVLGGTPRLGLAGGTIVRLVLTAVVLLVPTLAMGGTLPAAARAITTADDARRRTVAALYGFNTLGAVLGCVVATFFMLELFGTRATVWLAAGVNLLIAMFARQLDRGAPPLEDAPAADLTPSEARAPVLFVLMASSVVGFAFFLMELVWYRMLGPLIGGSVFTFGLILAVALVGVGVGGLLYALFGADRPASLGGFATTCLLEAAAIALAYALGDRLASLALVLTPLRLSGFAAQVIGWTAVTAIVVLPAALVAGYQFPMLIGLLGNGRTALGRHIGLAYATNTLGAIAGSLAGGFGLLPWLSAPGAWRFVSVALLALGAAATVIWEGRRLRTIVPRLALAAMTVALLTATGPTSVWRHSGIGAGRATPTSGSTVTPNQLRSWTRERQRALQWEGDGTESSVALIGDAAGYAFIVNGKSDGSAVGDSPTQVMLGLLGAFLNPGSRRSLVIGLGTGSTAGWLGAVPAMQRVDVVELEPLVLDVARDCALVNHDVLNNPDVHITIGDAREFLLLTQDRYDVIASEPSNPFRAGVASLFTREFYQAANDRLTADGLFLQWVQAYEVDGRTLRTVYATMASAFLHVETWQMAAGDLVLIGARHPIRYQQSELSARMKEEPFRTALLATWRAVDLTGLFAHYVAGDRMTRAIASAPGVEINEDDRNIVEFGFARALGGRGIRLAHDIRDLARLLDDAHPALSGATLDWSAVRTALVGFYGAIAYGTEIAPQGSGDELMRQTALLSYYSQSDFKGAREAWHQQAGEPRDPTDLVMVADIEADTGLDSALPYIERVRIHQPAEADTLLATLRFRQGRAEEAAVALESALRRYRSDPWPLAIMKERAIRLAGLLGGRDAAMAQRMMAALKHPLALRFAEDGRLTTAATLARTAGLASFCREPIAALEPYTPWTLEFLALRRDCYTASGDPGAAIAARELADFVRHEPLPFAAGLVP